MREASEKGVRDRIKKSATAIPAINRSALEELVQDEELYRKLFEQADDGIALLRGATVVECNQRALDILGCSREDAIGKTPWEISPGVTIDGVPPQTEGRQFIREAYDGGKVRFDWSHQNPDGSRTELDVTLAAGDLSFGRRVMVGMRDATSRKKSARELLSRMRFQALLSDMGEKMIFTRPEDINRRIRECLELIANRYDLDRIGLWWIDIEQRVTRVSHHFGRDGIELPVDEFEIDEAPWSHEQLLSGGEICWESIDDVPAEAPVDRAFFASRDVTSIYICPVTIGEGIIGNVAFSTVGRRRAWPQQDRAEMHLSARLVATAWQRYERLRMLREREAELLRSQRVARVGSYVETAKEGESLISVYGDWRFSQEACAIFGIEPGTENSESILALVHPDDRDAFYRSVELSVSEGAPTTLDYRIVRDDGETVYVEDHWEFDRDQDGNVFRIFGTVKDVTERVLAEQELRQALEENRKLREQLQDENLYLRREFRTAQRARKIVGENARFRSALVAAEKAAPTDVTVLILGETGTGKELVAREIHELSERFEKPLVSVNCAALSTELIESELFGHEVGAFTGARNRQLGRFEIADGGTLFLDEIGDLSADVQAKILRVLQTGEFERLGGTETLQVDVRLIAATNRNLRRMIKDGEFRADLFFRINSFPIELPPLRERTDDIPALANFFVEKHGATLGKSFETIAPAMLARMHAMEWPGNVRELESFMIRAMLASSGPVLDYVEVEPVSAVTAVPPGRSAVSANFDVVQEQHIRQVLEHCDWVIGGASGAAQALGMPPSTLRSRMKRLGIERPETSP